MAARSRKGAPGILDVALRAGVSGATVSRCFARPAVVRPDTRERVLRAAAELGYIRDRMASGLQRRVSGTVGLVVPTIDNAIFAELIEAFSHRLQDHDRTMLIASHDYDEQREVTIIRSLLERRIDAIALIGADHSSVALEMLAVRDLPIVALWCARGPEGIPAIGADNKAAAQKVAEHLIELGHRDIALLAPDSATNDRVRQRIEGIRETILAHGFALDERRMLECPYDTESAKSIAMQMLDADPPTAFICGNDIIAHGVLHAARRCGMRVPDELSVVGIGDFSGSAAFEPGLTTVRLPARRIGRLAADMLVEQLDGTAYGAMPGVVIETELIVRGSTARPRR